MPAQPSVALVEALCVRYRLGHSEIDAQHRRIFEIVARVDAGMPAPAVIDALYAYAGDHFIAEERIAEENNVLDAEHVAAHGALLDRLAAIRRAPEGEVRRLLVDWIGTHIDREDRELVGSINVGRRLRLRLGDED